MIYKLKVFSTGFMIMYGLSLFANPGKVISIETSNSQLVYIIGEDNKLFQSYFGAVLDKEDLGSVLQGKANAYPSFGTSYIDEPALRAVHSDGNTSTELLYVSHSTDQLDDNVFQTIIKMKDSYYPFHVNLCYKAYYDENIIESWTEISHTEDADVILYNYASSHLYFSEPSYYMTHFYGDFADEMNMKEVQLSRGQKVLDSKLGIQSNHCAHALFLLSLDAPAEEDHGRVIGATLAWPGSWEITFDVDRLNDLHILAGINPFASQYHLKSGENFKTPSLLYSYSHEGTGNITRSFHHWALKHGIHRGDRTRMTLLNNWEATYFNFNEKILSGIIKDAAEMNFELFLLDDGWFGNKYPRNIDNAGLGDWEVNKKKLPQGLGYLVKEAEKNKIKFGIWLEPEMVNPESELFKKHPDWVIGQEHRPLDLIRNQLSLDLSNPEVQDFVFNVIDKTLKENPGIAYIKWDCNRYITNSGSYYLPKDKQSHLWIEVVRGLYNVLDRVRDKYNDVFMMVCAGGGGRIDYATLPYFDEFWISDNNDAVSRIFIQWGATYFFPAMVLASHVSVVPNHTTGRSIPLKFRFDVAMSAKLGMDLQPMDMNPKEKEFSKNAIQEYYKIRDIVQFGNLYRLLSPYENERTAMMYVSDDKDKAVVYSYLLKKNINGNTQSLVLKGLDPEKNYSLTEINKDPDSWSSFSALEGKVFSGDFLMKYGIRFTMYNQYDSKIIKLQSM